MRLSRKVAGSSLEALYFEDIGEMMLDEEEEIGVQDRKEDGHIKYQ